MNTAPDRASREIRSARANRRPPSFAVMLIALAIVFALAWMFFVRSGTSTPAPAVDGIRGTYSFVSGSGAKKLTGTFGAVAGGDAGGDQAPDGRSLGLAPLQSAYDAGMRVETTLAGKGPGTSTRTVGAWPPVWRVATPSPLDYQGLAAIVRTAVEEGDDGVGIKPLKQGDRPVWRAALTLGGKEMNLVVDQETGIVTWYDDGETTFTADVQWDSPPTAGTTYSVAVPAGTPTRTVGKGDGAFHYVASPSAAAAAAGYRPLVSGLAPDGYASKATATVSDGYRPISWLDFESAGPGSPPAMPAQPVVTQLYTRGLSAFTVEQTGPPTARAYREALRSLAETARDRLSYQETTLQYGAFKGKTALTWYQESGPSLFVAGARRAVFVTGALTRQELIAFAEGLRPAAANAGE